MQTQFQIFERRSGDKSWDNTGQFEDTAEMACARVASLQDARLTNLLKEPDLAEYQRPWEYKIVAFVPDMTAAIYIDDDADEIDAAVKAELQDRYDDRRDKAYADRQYYAAVTPAGGFR